MTFNTIRLLAYSEASIPSMNDWMTGWEFSTTAIFPFVAVTGLCLIIYFILGVLWLKGRYSTPESYPERSMEQLSELSPTYDYVTGLPTRRLFGTLLEQAVERATKTGRFLALLVVELEHFRMVSEGQGHANHNLLVRVQAARVKGVLRSTETVARLAQDQFALILDNVTSHQEVTVIVERLLATVGLPLTLGGHELFLTCRIGVALYPQDATEHKELLKQAMRAVKTAKSEGQAVQFTSLISPIASEPASVLSEQTA